ncbi:5'-3' exoribonuclease 3 [Platanthera guangdongensis]|uniref:5'-3' exoribonuclease 3 n=1 Tax=Platanthera guangdongensis TaxID=2320717 RepID=A0ABR2MFX2_9ASPA
MTEEEHVLPERVDLSEDCRDVGLTNNREEQSGRTVKENEEEEDLYVVGRKSNVGRNSRRQRKSSRESGMKRLLNIWTFREYLELDMKPECQSVVDIERIVDDFIFICFFSGNNFLPHLPSIEIHESDIEAVIIRMEEQFIKYGKGRIILEDDDEGNRWLPENPFEVRSDWEQHILDRRGHMCRTMLRKVCNLCD